MPLFSRGTLLIAGAFIALARPARAQELRGTVRDAASRQPIPGAVITLLDARDAALGRNITDERGHYRIALPSTAVRLRFVRIGFRPVTANSPRSGAPVDTLDLVMTSIPTMLDPVSVRADACPRRADAGPALGLLEQARAGLLNSVVARNANPASVVILRVRRSMDGTSDRIVSQSVLIDSTERATSSFYAARSASEFVTAGFVNEEADGATFFGPDADALLDDAFIAAYCFRLVKGDGDHSSEVGLGFSTPRRVNKRIDIDGVLWVDTTLRRLQRLEFRYVGLDRRLDEARPGGWISFREMPNGVVFIDRWALRLPVIRVDSAFDARTHEYTPRRWVEAQESGGEVAQIQWASSPPWRASLASLRLQAVNQAKRPAAGARLRLDSTSYAAVTDSSGSATITRLLPGPYKLVVEDSQLERIGISLSTPIAFTAARDSVHRAQLVVPTANDYVRDRCTRDAKWYRTMPRPQRDVVWLIGRVVGPDDTPMSGASAEAFQGGRGKLAADELDAPRVGSMRTGTDGIFQMCSGMFHVGDTALVRVYHRGLPTIELIHPLTDTVSALPLFREPRRP